MVFIYKKNKQIKVLTSTEAFERNQQLINNGWEHSSTLNPCIFLEYLHNNLDEAINQIKEL